MKIKTLIELRDESGETDLLITAGNILTVDSDEGDYWIVRCLDFFIPVDKDAGIVMEADA